jgi:phage repressor protein C with HTH and peptisase S24 domain
MAKKLAHSDVWLAIDLLAAKHGLSASGLALRAGLNETTFNISKRRSPTGKPHWPSTETIARILAATDESIVDFVSLPCRPRKSRSRKLRRRVRV